MIIELTIEQVHLLLMTTDAGLINYRNVQNVLSGVYQNNANEEHTKELMGKVGEIRKIIIDKLKEEANKPKIEIVKT